MDQRVSLLTERLNVIGDLLAVLKDQLTVTHVSILTRSYWPVTDKPQGELLEWIVIILIFAEVVVAAINIFVDLHAAD
jgi:uncharacterized Rmd1/YagE family protein